MKLTRKEEAWLERFRKTMTAAPDSLRKKISSYTMGDDNIMLYDVNKFELYFEVYPLNSRDISDHCTLVEKSDSEIEYIPFPFKVESTAG